MDELDYLFLDTAITEIIGFSWIVPANRHKHEIDIDSSTYLTINEIAESLHRLFQGGNLLAISSSELGKIYTNSNNSFEHNSILSNKGFVPSYLEVNSALKQEDNLFYFLTDKGGELWESVSHPKWDQYYFSAGNENEHILRCHSRELAAKILEIQHLLDFGRSYHSPIIETVNWNFFSPWQPTYWKKLLSGYEISYQVTSIDVDMIENEDEELIEKRKQAEKWVEETKKWYTNYSK
jgi:hypothetical protein